MDVELETGLQVFHEVRRTPRIVPWLQKMEDHDLGLSRHSLLAGAIASVAARSFRLTGDDEWLLVTGALLHDVGKLSVDKRILQKSGPLTVRERAELERHPEMGAQLLARDGWEPSIVELVHLHHERLDGSGYPHGYFAEKIGRLVRMVTLCDVFSALIEDRAYRPSARRPLDIMSVMDSELDLSLLVVFSQDVPDLAYRAQRILMLEPRGALLTDA